MAISIMDDMNDGKPLHQRRQWISQYQVETVDEINPKPREEKNLIPLRAVSPRGGMKYILSNLRITGFVSLAIMAFVALNLTQGPVFNDYLSMKKIQHNVHASLRSLRRGFNCGSPYVTPKEAAYSMPLTPTWYPEQPPTHIILCDELLKRNKLATEGQDEDGEGVKASLFTKFVVSEVPQVCTDWSKPHSALMQIISSSIVATVGERFGLEYTHNCHHTINAEYRRNLPFDVTTVQEVFPILRMPVDQKVLPLGEVLNLCSNCIEEYSSSSIEYGSAEATHHCLAFPDRGSVKVGTITQQIKGPDGMPQMVQKQELLDSQGRVFHTALESVLPLARNRLWHGARDWSLESNIPHGDPSTGVVIFIDAGSSMPIPFRLFIEQIPPHATQISIMSGPNCAQGFLSISMSQLQPLSCLQYGSELRDYLTSYYQDVGIGVSFTLLSSTAASYTRMIQTCTLICPPQTISCLLPTLAKERYKNAVVFESPESTTYSWFNYLGTSVTNIEIIRLNYDEMTTDREQQFIDAKYAGFSAAQVIGKAPPGVSRPSPVSEITGKKTLVVGGSGTSQNSLPWNPSSDSTTSSSSGSSSRTSSGSNSGSNSIILPYQSDLKQNTDSYVRKDEYDVRSGGSQGESTVSSGSNSGSNSIILPYQSDLKQNTDSYVREGPSEYNVDKNHKETSNLFGNGEYDVRSGGSQGESTLNTNDNPSSTHGSYAGADSYTNTHTVIGSNNDKDEYELIDSSGNNQAGNSGEYELAVEPVGTQSGSNGNSGEYELADETEVPFHETETHVDIDHKSIFEDQVNDQGGDSKVVDAKKPAETSVLFDNKRQEDLLKGKEGSNTGRSNINTNTKTSRYGDTDLVETDVDYNTLFQNWR